MNSDRVIAKSRGGGSYWHMEGIVDGVSGSRRQKCVATERRSGTNLVEIVSRHGIWIFANCRSQALCRVLLDSVIFRVGLIAGLRSKKLNGQYIGIMITASHNQPAMMVC